MLQPSNVFRGPDAVRRYFDPDCSPPLPLVEIPDRLNPFRGDGVRIYAKLLTALPAQNVKALPALLMLQERPDAATKSIVEASSGSTVLSLAMAARVLWGNTDTTAYVTNKKHPDSLRLLRMLGLGVSLYGGLAQQEPTDPEGIMSRLRRRARDDDSVCYPGQYDNENNWKSHERWTGPQIYEQLPEINIFATTVGTGGCITGTGKYLKEKKPSVKVVGVFNVFGDPTPGPRHMHGFKTCGFPWTQVVDSITEVASADSYRMSMRLSREGIIAGPSSGEALQGLLDHIADLKAGGRLAEAADPATGDVSCVFTCSDLPYQYLDGYFQKLDESEFPPILNAQLLECDQDRHDERWILPPREAAAKVLGDGGVKAEAPAEGGAAWQHQGGAAKKPSALPGPSVLRSMGCLWGALSRGRNDETGGGGLMQCCGADDGAGAEAGPRVGAAAVLDLRPAAAFAARHLRASHSLPVARAGGDDEDLFGDAVAVSATWRELKAALESAGGRRAVAAAAAAAGGGGEVLVLCARGDASRLATALLRARGVEASSVAGGFAALWRELDGL